MANKNLSAAKSAKNDEFYTQYADIQKEVNAYLVFPVPQDEMCGLEWGRLYEAYHKTAYSATKMVKRVEELLADECVTNKRGIFEYLLGGEKDAKLLNVRVFETSVAKRAYQKQTADAKKKGVSNCPLCVHGPAATASKIWDFKEMDADHVTAWSKGGATTASNCQMLCKTHNRSKGNR